MAEINVTFQKSGDTLTVIPEGRLDTATSPLLEQKMNPELGAAQHLIMDFAKVDYISSSGLRLLLAAHQNMEDRGGDLRMIHVNEYIRDVLNLVGFLEIMNVE